MQKLLTSLRTHFQSWRAGRESAVADHDAVMTDAHSQRLTQAQALHQEARLDEAEIIYRELLRQYPRNLDILLALGAVQGQRGNFADATRWMEQALVVDPDSAGVHSNLGNCYKCTGRFQQALDSYDRALRLEKTADTLANRGATFADMGRHGEALDSFDQALELQADHAMAFGGRVAALAQLGRHEELLAIHQRVAASDPDNHSALFSAAASAIKLRKFGDALAYFDQALKLRPDVAAVHNDRGAVLTELKRYDEAVSSLEKAIALTPDFVDAYLNLGIVLRTMERHEDAIRRYDEALKIAPDHAGVRINRGTSLVALERPEEALTECDIVLDRDPCNIDALISRGGLLHTVGRSDEGLECLQRAMAIKPDAADALYNSGIIYQDRHQYAEAAGFFERAAAIKPAPETLGNLGVMLVNLRRHDEAMDSYTRAQAIAETPRNHINIALCQLQLGNYPLGWPEYEWRWETTAVFKKEKRLFSQPQWTGAEAISGKTLLLYGEQGFGDTLHMCRFAKHVAALGAKVILETQRGMQQLLADTEGASLVLDAGSRLPPFDYHCPLMSVPLALGITLENIPQDVPYVHSQPAEVARWREQLGVATKPRIGFVWSGNKEHGNDRNRSLTLEKLQPLLSADFEWVSLQKEVREADEVFLRQGSILDVRAQLRNFNDTAALVELMDIVIAVDTSVAHLAAAMGKPVWILLPFNSDWRWLLDRDDSPWYPTARLFRQPAQYDWDSVIASVRTELERALQTMRSSSV